MFPSHDQKKLRKRFGNGIRFFHCGEYGSKFGRPHYHALIFGFDFPDKYFWKMSNGMPLYRSNALEELWTYGYSSIGSVTFESAAYVARYVVKKITGDMADKYYLQDDIVDVDTGEVMRRKPEYCTMSRGCKKLGTGGIGKSWFDDYFEDVYPHDFLYLRNRKMKPPKYFDSMYEAYFPHDFEEVKAKRLEDAAKREADFVNAFPDAHLRLMHADVLRRHKELSVKRLVRCVDEES